MPEGKSREAKRLITDGYVGDFKETDENQWDVVIEGFMVRTVLDNKGSLFYAECNCGKAVCSHITAAQIALQKMLENELHMENDDRKLKKLIGELSRSELAELALEYALSNKRTGKEILIRYAPKDNSLKYARTVATEIVNLAKATRTITEKEAAGRDAGLGILDKLAGEALSSKEIHKAMMLQSMRLDSLVEIDGVIRASEQTVRLEIADSISKVKELADLCVTDPILGYEFLSMLEKTVPRFIKGEHNILLYDFFQALSVLALNDRNICKLDQLAVLAEAMSVDHKLSVLINLADHLEKSDGYFDSRLNEGFRRKILVEAYIATAEYEKVLSVCEEAGNPDELFTFRCEALEKTGDIKKLKAVYEERAFAASDLDSYVKLKALFSEEEWSKKRAHMITRAKKAGAEFMEEVFKLEDAKKELLDICLENTAKIKDMYQHLLPEYASAASDLMENKILSLAYAARARKGCLSVCSYLEAYIAAGGAAENLIKTICGLYPQRRTLLEMLKKYL
jgi:hypothetical protein